jgi:hypothetical protein
MQRERGRGREDGLNVGRMDYPHEILMKSLRISEFPIVDSNPPSGGPARVVGLARVAHAV